MRKNISLIFMVFLLLFTPKIASAGVCNANPATSLVGAGMFTNIDWAGIAPIRIGGVPVIPGMPDVQDEMPPVCLCSNPVPRIGITFSMWNPENLTEVVQDPYCFPGVGINIPNPTGVFGNGTVPKKDHHMAFFQAHYYNYPVWAAIGMLQDAACMQSPAGSTISIPFISEPDPIWQSDILADFASPEAVLFANPVAQMSCIADSVASQAYQPLNFMFWCMGSWGGVYPVDGDTGGTKDNLESAAAIAGKTIYWMHHILLQFGTAGPLTYEGSCQDYPDPIWQKSQVRLDLSLPIPEPYLQPIGQTSIVWSELHNVPFIGGNYTFTTFDEKDCCLF